MINSEHEEAPAKFAVQLLMVLLPGSFFAALLFYYGWAYTNALYRVYGLTPEVLHFSTNDYLLRSINVVCRFLLEFSLLVLLLVVLQRGIDWWYQAPQYPRLKQRLARLALVIGLLGCGIFGPNVHGAFEPYIDVLAACFGLCACLIVIGYSLRLLRQCDPAAASCIERLGMTSAAARGAFVALCAAAIFITSGIYAQRVGQSSAAFWERNAAWLVSVTVYSRRDLAMIDEPGVLREVLSSDPEGYRYRYSGLKLLIRTGEEYFVFPKERSPREGIILLRQNDEMRIEFEPGAG